MGGGEKIMENIEYQKKYPKILKVSAEAHQAIKGYCQENGLILEKAVSNLLIKLVSQLREGK